MTGTFELIGPTEWLERPSGGAGSPESRVHVVIWAFENGIAGARPPHP